MGRLRAEGRRCACHGGALVCLWFHGGAAAGAKVRGCRARGQASDPPFDHKTGRGRVAAHRGHYFDAIYNKKNKVVLVLVALVEALGGIIDETMDELGRLARAGQRALARSTAIGTGSIARAHNAS
eukprot:scaffold22290_cov101-Isochrysis_galbana.AAC.2